MTSIEARIQVLEDKDAIRELTAKYCYAVVAQDSEALLDMFTEDGEFHYSTDMVSHLREDHHGDDNKLEVSRCHGNDTKSEVARLAMELGRRPSSIVAKLESMGIYRKADTARPVGKSKGTRQDKAKRIDALAGLSESQSDKPPQFHFCGRKELAQLYQDKIEELGPKPFIQNHVIQIDGDTATGNCAVEIRLVDEGKAFTACGHYDDIYRRVNGEWKFARRDFELYHWVPLAEGWAG